jgi:hypothetical protein
MTEEKRKNKCRNVAAKQTEAEEAANLVVSATPLLLLPSENTPKIGFPLKKSSC